MRNKIISKETEFEQNNQNNTLRRAGGGSGDLSILSDHFPDQGQQAPRYLRVYRGDREGGV